MDVESRRIKGMDAFLRDYRTFSQSLTQLKLHHYKSRYETLFSGYRGLKSTIERLNKQIADSFNIFSILKLDFNETRAHTPFLRNLLDPQGSHGQIDLFYEQFLTQVCQDSEKRSQFILASPSNYLVEEEKFTGNGYIDILITSLDANKKFGLVIENKIYAGEQERQVERYYNYLIDTKKLSYEQVLILYLSINGDDPKSINNKLKGELKSKGVLKSISYRKDIFNWLETAKKEVKAPVVIQIINQYLHTINKL